jgi:hypothetical protein
VARIIVGNPRYQGSALSEWAKLILRDGSRAVNFGRR